MGGSVSAGVDNNDLVDNLLAADYIKTPSVERVFRAVDRGMYFTAVGRENAYKDLAWKSGNIHLSAPCIYCEVMENLNLAPGLSFLNLGSGTGYLSTMAGLILGSFGINHGVEIHHDVLQYAQEKLELFKKTAAAMDEFDFCEPKFVEGNCLQLDSNSMKYDRVYCGAACPPSFETYMNNLIKVGGILVIPLNDRLLKITRVSESVWEERSVLPVSFASLLEPSTSPSVTLPTAEPISLMDACRTAIRSVLQAAVDREHPELKIRLPPKVKSKKQRTLRRLFIPMFETSDSMAVVAGSDRRCRFSEGDSDDNMPLGEPSNSDTTSPDQPSCDDSGGSSSTSRVEKPVRVRLQSRPVNNHDQSSDESDDPSDISSSSSLTSSYRVQQALFRVMAHDIASRNIPFTFTVMRPSPGNNVPPSLPDFEVSSSDSSSSPQDESSDNSMDVDEPDPSERSEAVVKKSKMKRAETLTSKRARNKRKEAEMEESDYPSQSSGRVLRSSNLSGTSSNDGKLPSNNSSPLPLSKKKNAAKREKVDSGIGEDINNWDISPSDVGSDFASDSDSEDDTNDVCKPDDKLTFLHRRRHCINSSPDWRKRGAQSLSQDVRQQETNNYGLYMRSKIQLLPLPGSLKSYLNYHRDL